MTTSSEPPPSQENTYILGHSIAEMVRLTEQDRHFTEGMGGLLPEQADLSGIHRVLDVACGPGGWVLELAQAYPQMQVVGIDIDPGMISYATEQARASRLSNVQFRVMNALEPLDFPDAYFDLVNSRFMVGFLPPMAWPTVLAEFMRITRRGGILRLTEQEWTGCSSAAYETTQRLTFRASVQAGVNSFNQDARHIGITPRLRRLLHQAGYVDLEQVAYALDFSAGTAAHANFYLDLSVAQQLLHPFKVAMGVATEEQLDQLDRQIQIEMMQDDFYGIMYLLTVWGKRP
jgi:ubiquinone/menaquinone biosynthesis C-methylase UbiE